MDNLNYCETSKIDKNEFLNICIQRRDEANKLGHSINISGGYNDFSFFTITIDSNELEILSDGINIHKGSFVMELHLTDAHLYKDDTDFQTSLYIVYKNKNIFHNYYELESNYDIVIEFYK